MSPSEIKSLSKFLSLVLRHDPAAAGVSLDPAGWTSVDALIDGAKRAGRVITREQLELVVATSDKKRFTLSENGARIRAAQGHSVPVDLGLRPATPPETLYHGTSENSAAAIRAEGLRPRSRQHVHLSPDAETARAVGMRHGRPFIFLVDAARAFRDGQTFWRADNGVWLTGPLAPDYLSEVAP